MPNFYEKMIASLGGGRTPRFNPIVNFEDVLVANAAGAVSPHKETPQKKLNVDSPLWGLHVSAQFHVRVAVGATAPATALTLNDEFPLGFIDRFELRGSNKFFGNSETFQNVNANSLYRMLNAFRKYIPGTVKVSRNGGAYVQQLDNGSAPVAAPTNTATTNTDYDVIVDHIIPFVPSGIREWLSFLLNPSHWTDLTLNMYVADPTGLFDHTVQANAPTITYGALQGTPDVTGGTAASSGSPLLRVSLIPMRFGNSEADAQAKYAQYGIGTKLLYRTFQNLTTPVQSNGNGILLARLTTQDLPYIRFFLKTGSLPTTPQTSGVASVINSLTEGLVTLVYPKKNQTQIRLYLDRHTAKDFSEQAHEALLAPGYFMEDFCMAGTLRDAIDTTGLTSDQLTLIANVANSSASSVAELIEERVKSA